jgi:hypothetical protein
MSDTITYTGRLVVLTCWCGMAHAVPSEFRSYQMRCHDNGGVVPDIFCPLGHAHIPSGKGKAERERERREAAEAALSATRDQLSAERKEHAATKGQLTKAKKRAFAGVCPCCNRSFVDVRRHMVTKHPEQLKQIERKLP